MPLQQGLWERKLIGNRDIPLAPAGLFLFQGLQSFLSVLSFTNQPIRDGDFQV